jgi:hypothetical protein
MDNLVVKEQIRAWLRQRVAKPAPPPEPEQIRRAIGWGSAAPTRQAARETGADQLAGASGPPVI